MIGMDFHSGEKVLANETALNRCTAIHIGECGPRVTDVIRCPICSIIRWSAGSINKEAVIHY